VNVQDFRNDVCGRVDEKNHQKTLAKMTDFDTLFCETTWSRYSICRKNNCTNGTIPPNHQASTEHPGIF